MYILLMYPSDRQLQYFYTLTQFIRIIKDFERKVSIQRKSFLWWFIRVMEVANQVMFFLQWMLASFTLAWTTKENMLSSKRLYCLLLTIVPYYEHTFTYTNTNWRSFILNHYTTELHGINTIRNDYSCTHNHSFCHFKGHLTHTICHNTKITNIRFHPFVHNMIKALFSDALVNTKYS